jgi:hypothetical protein
VERRLNAGTETPAILAAGPRTVLRRPLPTDEPEFLAAVLRSRELHHPWVHPPTDSAGYLAYLQRGDRPAFVGLLLCLAADGAPTGAFNLSQIGRWRDHERWAILADGIEPTLSP